jgi:hypothetical protein
MLKTRFYAACAVAGALVTVPGLADEPAGTVIFAVGKVEQRSPDGATRALAKGDAVQEGDTILTGPGSHAQLVMSDKARIAVRPDSELRLAVYRYRGAEDGSEQATLELMKGAFRSLTGAIGTTHKKSYHINSGPLTIGVRGTDHETWRVESGVYNRVTIGGTYLAGPHGRVDLDPVQVGFAPLAPESPVRLPSSPEFMLAAFAPASANTGPSLRPHTPADQQRLRQPVGAVPDGLKVQPSRAAQPVQSVERLRAAQPIQSLGDNARNGGFGRGGRCGGPCGPRFRP